MGDMRDPERDQPAPKPGKLPVQEIMILAIQERREYGRRKYGRVLETDNGRDALKDAWEEALDLFTYLTQARLERGDRIEGMDRLAGSPEPEYGEVDGIRPHRPMSLGEAEERKRLASAIDQKTVARVRALIPDICPQCRHEPHTPGHCRSQALNLGCGCLCV